MERIEIKIRRTDVTIALETFKSRQLVDLIMTTILHCARPTTGVLSAPESRGDGRGTLHVYIHICNYILQNVALGIISFQETIIYRRFPLMSFTDYVFDDDVCRPVGGGLGRDIVLGTISAVAHLILRVFNTFEVRNHDILKCVFKLK